MDLARESIRAATQAGADAVKFQNFRAGEFVVGRELTYSYGNNSEMVTETQFAMFKRPEPPRQESADLRRLCDSLGSFYSTPMSQAGIDDLVAIDKRILKNGSNAMTHRVRPKVAQWIMSPEDAEQIIEISVACGTCRNRLRVQLLNSEYREVSAPHSNRLSSCPKLQRVHTQRALVFRDLHACKPSTDNEPKSPASCTTMT